MRKTHLAVNDFAVSRKPVLACGRPLTVKKGCRGGEGCECTSWVHESVASFRKRDGDMFVVTCEDCLAARKKVKKAKR